MTDEPDQVEHDPETAAPIDPPARVARPVKIADVRYEMICEADRIRTTQDCLVRAGLRSAPDEGMLRRADVFDAGVRLLDKLEPRLPQVLEMLKTPPASAKKKAGGR